MHNQEKKTLDEAVHAMDVRSSGMSSLVGRQPMRYSIPALSNTAETGG
ncbi:hypothetical protein FBZ98_11650 [Rhizobium sp. ERR 922]|nr:hypothetical protein FBZ98_11650 [Rhizobium sp. ERR 922]TWB87918.1 hypothetical protein FBZ97_1154 [Rhizobium sp. ERR 942]